MGAPQAHPGRIAILREILLSPFLLLFFAIFSFAYFLVIKYFITVSSYGIFLSSVPVPLLYVLSITSSFVLTISAYSVKISLKYGKMGAEEGAASMATVLIGSLITSCGCSAPVLGIVLYFLGANAILVGNAISFISANQYWLLGTILALNLLLSNYSLGRLSSLCTINRDGRVNAGNTRNGASSKRME